MHKGDVIDVLGNIGEEVGDILATLSVLIELPAGLDDAALVLFAAATEGFHIDGFAIHAKHVRFVVKGVDVAGATIHEEEDDAFGLAWKLGGALG